MAIFQREFSVDIMATYNFTNEPKYMCNTTSVATITGLKVIGTIGILILANKIGKLDSLKVALDQLKKNKFRISDEVYQMALRKGRGG